MRESVFFVLPGSNQLLSLFSFTVDLIFWEKHQRECRNLFCKKMVSFKLLVGFCVQIFGEFKLISLRISSSQA